MTDLEDDSHIAHEDAVLLLPWYVTGRLSDLDALRMQRHLAECESCNAEATAEQTLRASIGGAPVVRYAPQASLAKLLERIDAQERKKAAWRARLSWMVPRWPLAPRRSARAWMRTLAIAAGVQATAIIVLFGVVSWFAFRSAPPADYRTLTAMEVGSSANAAAVRVVFDESLRVTDMQSLLRSIGARIVSGPTQVGAYTIHVDAEDPSAKSAAQIAHWLRAQPGVRFAEPIVLQE
jgi:anti-sigma factor RsiW